MKKFSILLLILSVSISCTAESEPETDLQLSQTEWSGKYTRYGNGSTITMDVVSIIFLNDTLGQYKMEGYSDMRFKYRFTGRILRIEHHPSGQLFSEYWTVREHTDETLILQSADYDIRETLELNNIF